MTALEEIKKPEHERIWLEPAGAPDRCWCQDNQWGDDGVEYVLASTLESLQRENEALKKDRDFWKEQFQVETRYRIELADRGTLLALTDANSRAEAAEAEVKLIREAVGELLAQAEHVCLGAHTPADIKEAARNLATPIKNVHTALASTGGEHHAK